jgi:hypothetical protein
MFKNFILITLLLGGSTLVKADAISDFKNQIIGMSDKEIWNEASAGRVGKCRIHDASACRASGNCYCNYYVQTDPTPGSQYNGLPGVNNATYGTGCLFTQEVPTCWGGDNSYAAHPELYCTSDKIKNAANMIRTALSNATTDFCKIGEYVATLYPGAGLSIGTLVDNGDVEWPHPKFQGRRTPSKCYARTGDMTTINTAQGSKQVRALTKLSPQMCKKLARRIIKTKPNHFTEEKTMEFIHAVAIDFGTLSPIQINQAITNSYLVKNVSYMQSYDQIAANLQPLLIKPVSQLTQAEVFLKNKLQSQLGSLTAPVLPSSTDISAEIGKIMYPSDVQAPSDTTFVKRSEPNYYLSPSLLEVVDREPASLTPIGSTTETTKSAILPVQ